MSVQWNYLWTYLWPLGTHGPPSPWSVTARVDSLQRCPSPSTGTPSISACIFDAPLPFACTEEIRANRFERNMEALVDLRVAPWNTQPTLPLECHCKSEYSTMLLKPLCPLPVQRKFGLSDLSGIWNYLWTYLWLLGTHSPTSS